MVVREKTASEKSSYVHQEFSPDTFTKGTRETMKDIFEIIHTVDKSYVNNGSANFKIVFRSKTQEQGFNFPYQIGTNGNSPKEAEESTVDVLPGDLVILGTDGLFDNLYSISIMEDIEKLNREKNLKPDAIAKQLAESAFKLSLEDNYVSPFSMSALLNIGMFYKGGKSDDITVSVGIVQN